MKIFYTLFILAVMFTGANAGAVWIERPASIGTIPAGVSKPINTGNNLDGSEFIKQGGLTIYGSGKKSSSQLIVKNGNAGLGTLDPLAKLHINGPFKMIYGSKVTGKILTSSDTTGKAIWGDKPTTMPSSIGSINVPAGAVMAFDLRSGNSGQIHGECPVGWSHFGAGDGRVIVGAGGKYRWGDTGGEAKTQLTLENIPAHYHTYEVSTDDGSVNDYDDSDEDDGKDEQRVTTDVKDINTKDTGGQPHNNMMPYVGLTYCIKN